MVPRAKTTSTSLHAALATGTVSGAAINDESTAPADRTAAPAARLRIDFTPRCYRGEALGVMPTIRSGDSTSDRCDGLTVKSSAVSRCP